MFNKTANKNVHIFLAIAVMVLFVGVFPVTRVYAQDYYDDGTFDSSLDYGSTDYSGYDDGTYDTTPDYASTDYSDYGTGYDYGTYDSSLNYDSTDYGTGYDDGTYSSGLDSGSTDYSGDGTYLDDTGDTGTYYDDNTGDTGTYYDDTGDCGSSCNGTFYDDTADTGTYYDDTANNNGTYYDDQLSTNCDSGCTEENGVDYTNNETQEEIQTATVATPITVTAPQYVTTTPILSIPRPVYASTPIITPTPRPTPTPVVTQPSVTTNTCTNGSCNTTNTYSPTTNTYTYSNNGNTTISGSYNTAYVAPITQTPVQYQAQYVFPAQPIVYQAPIYPINNLSCSIVASPTTIVYNQPTTLSWSAPGATTAVLSDGIGSVAPNGSLIARPASSVDYVLTVWGPQGQTSTCNVWITVSGSQVSLTQIPYTGFDFGPFGDALYWLGLLAFAGAAGYLLVYYKGGAAVLTSEMIRSNKKVAPVAQTSSAIVSATPTVAPAPIAKAAPVVNSHMTTDSMRVHHGHHGDMPRIVISRN